MTKIKLLYFCSDYKVGLTQALTEQVEQLSKQNEVELYCISSEDEQEPGLHERLKRIHVHVTIVPGLDVHTNFKALSQKIANLIKSYGITHVNVQNNWQLGLVGVLRINPFNGLHFKLIYTIHGYRHNHPVKAVIAIATIGMALWLFTDRVISMSDYVSKRFWFLGYKTDRVFYMMNKPEYMKTENRIDTTPLSLVFPAQFREGKRQDMLIKAVKKYVDMTGDKQIVLHLPGNGPLLEQMKELANKLNLSNQVKFYGKLSLNEVISIYEKSNLALCSSNVETYGRCIAEPFMLGRCVITQRTGVAGDIIKHGENGFFFKNENDLAKILCSLHERPEKIKQITDRSFKDREIFFPSNVMKTYIDSLKKA